MYYRSNLEDIFKEFNTSLNGINEKSVETLRNKYGFNRLQEKKSKSVFQLFLLSFKDPLVIILLIAAGIQIFTNHIIDSVIIFLVLVLNSILGVVQTKKAESSLEALKKLSAPNAKVIRDGKKISVPASELLPGDIVFLDAGDLVPADGRVITCETLKVMEGSLTGESEPVQKENIIISKEVPLGDRKNMLYSGTVVVYGRGTYLVTSTGMNSELGKIATLLNETAESVTPLQKKLDKFTGKLGIGILTLCTLIFLFMIGKEYYKNGKLSDLTFLINAFMFAVAVAVAAIPEALSSIVTIVLSVNMNLMAKKKAIIRKLPAVETLGSTAVICTDKTGTLTKNKMTVVDIFLKGIPEPNFSECLVENETQEKLFLLAAALVNDSHIDSEGKEVGDPTEIALTNFVHSHKCNVNEIRDSLKRLGELPFDSDRKIMSTIHHFNGRKIMLCKGAPDVILSRSKYAMRKGEVTVLDSTIKKIYFDQNEEYATHALRVLALAFRYIDKEDFVPSLDDEKDLTIVGLIAMIDPPRDEVIAAVENAKSAGIKTVMITGDHKTTASAIAKNIGIISDDELALTGAELDLLSDSELDEKLSKISVYARVSPENKIRIVNAWKRAGKVTAMTGDGVNDAPALKSSDIGIAMGSGTEVAKDAADLVLTDDSFATIIEAVEIGRTVYSNIKKSIFYLFTGNLAKIIAIMFALIAGWSAPFTALQLLFINLINDSLPAIALGLEPSEKDVLKTPPRDNNEPLFTKSDYYVILSRAIIIAVATILAQFIGGQSMSFTTLIFCRILQTYSTRSKDKTSWELGLFSNKYANIAVVTCFTLFSISMLPIVRDIFKISPDFGIKGVIISLVLAITSVLVIELEKILIRGR